MLSQPRFTPAGSLHHSVASSIPNSFPPNAPARVQSELRPFLFVTALVVFFPLIVITCGLAALPLTAIAMMAHAHLNWQLYTIYLARGGEPIPLKAWEGPPPG
jgi:hypothetical protein